MKWVLLCGLSVILGCRQPGKLTEATAPTTAAAVASVEPRVSAEPVDVSVTADATTIYPGATIDVLVVFDIAPTYEIHARHAPPPAIATKLGLGLAAGFDAIGDWSEPTTVRSQWPDGHPVHAGRATFSQKVRVSSDVKPGQYPLSCRVFYQACNDRYCLPPVKLQVLGSLTVASPAASPR